MVMGCKREDPGSGERCRRLENFVHFLFAGWISATISTSELLSSLASLAFRFIVRLGSKAAGEGERV